ncbi:MAG: prolyl oligopeptidase family serine peptidase [Acidobacteriota bacterium]
MARAHLLLLFVSLLPAQQTVSIPATSDGAMQPAVVWFPTGISTPVPLVVHLHSWSSHFDSSEAWRLALKEAQKRNWAFVGPEFRGPNDRPEACASPTARQDILDAVNYMRKNHKIDAKRIYLLGSSGGGHMTLVMAAHNPKIWRAASAWVPVSDLATWYDESRQRDSRYWKMMEGCTGGTPATAAQEYKLRSPLPYLQQARGLPLDIQDGITDGHNGGSVPVSHSLRAFNVLADSNHHPEARFTEPEIQHIVTTMKVPPGSPTPPTEDRRTRILLRRTAGPARITLFDGGHESDFPAAFLWFDSLNK